MQGFSILVAYGPHELPNGFFLTTWVDVSPNELEGS